MACHDYLDVVGAFWVFILLYICVQCSPCSCALFHVNRNRCRQLHIYSIYRSIDIYIDISTSIYIHILSCELHISKVECSALCDARAPSCCCMLCYSSYLPAQVLPAVHPGGVYRRIGRHASSQPDRTTHQHLIWSEIFQQPSCQLTRSYWQPSGGTPEQRGRWAYLRRTGRQKNTHMHITLCICCRDVLQCVLYSPR